MVFFYQGASNYYLPGIIPLTPSTLGVLNLGKLPYFHLHIPAPFFLARFNIKAKSIFNMLQWAEAILNEISNNINKNYTGLISALEGFKNCIPWAWKDFFPCQFGPILPFHALDAMISCNTFWNP